MSKDSWMKLIAILVVLAFLLEIFAFGGGGSMPIDDGTGRINDSGEVIVGIAVVEGKLTSYGRELFVLGDEGEIGPIIDELEAEGLVQYTAPGSGGSVVLNLARHANITELAAEFDGVNASTAARARLQLPTEINFTTAEGWKSAAFQDSAWVEIAPVVEIGENLTVRITANILGEVVVEYAAEPVSIEISFSANATVVEHQPAHTAVVQIGWDERAFDDGALQEAFLSLYPDGNFTLYRDSRVLVELEGEFEKEYVIGREERVLLINESFTNSSRIEADLLAANASAIQFPDSVLVLEFEQTEQADLSFISDYVNYSLLEDYRPTLVELRSTVEYNNQTVEVEDEERRLMVLMPYEPAGSEVELRLVGDLFANTVMNLAVQGN
ncbi:hypothetical protein DRN67_00855 [Candidatus Micrarchaeota archaeon]|nr:MAG: hypothetical protein DRN67_00855 [Candidatus Micrarchaeota archaeon]